MTRPEILKPEADAEMTAAVIVAHPDDETLWCGGLMLANPQIHWFIAALCRKSDTDRSEKFFQALERYGAAGAMADLPDEPGQHPLSQREIQNTLAVLLPAKNYQRILTHAPVGEYTRHIRHEEVSQAVRELWRARAILAGELWMFAYEDQGGRDYPRAIATADQFNILSEHIWQEKYRLVTEHYGFSPQSWEAHTTPREEAFWRFKTPEELYQKISGEIYGS